MSYYILGHEVDSKESLSNNREKSIRKKTFALIAGFQTRLITVTAFLPTVKKWT